jgi:hypothetical protein
MKALKMDTHFKPVILTIHFKTQTHICSLQHDKIRVSPIMKKTWYLKQRICFQKYTYEFIMHDIPTVTQNSFYLVDDGGILAIQPTASQTIASISSLHTGIIIFKNVPMTQINSR